MSSFDQLVVRLLRTNCQINQERLVERIKEHHNHIAWNSIFLKPFRHLQQKYTLLTFAITYGFTRLARHIIRLRNFHFEVPIYLNGKFFPALYLACQHLTIAINLNNTRFTAQLKSMVIMLMARGANEHEVATDEQPISFISSNNGESYVTLGTVQKPISMYFSDTLQNFIQDVRLMLEFYRTLPIIGSYITYFFGYQEIFQKKDERKQLNVHIVTRDIFYLISKQLGIDIRKHRFSGLFQFFKLDGEIKESWPTVKCCELHRHLRRDDFEDSHRTHRKEESFVKRILMSKEERHLAML